jgi:ubiquinone/menaquinone biosynthesis C-methylase UbiE
MPISLRDEKQDTNQDKSAEIAFFDKHAAADDYNVFTPAANARLIDTAIRLLQLERGSRIADLGCGSGIFSSMLRDAGYIPSGLDISPKLIELAQRNYPGIEFLEGDVENLPFSAASLDGLVLMGIVHHFPDPSRCAQEAFRVLRPGGRFVAFDPNRMNPFMYLYRDRSSPFYSSVGVTKNERPVLAREVAATFERAGFSVTSHYLAGLTYRYVASARTQRLLPVYNWIESKLFNLGIMRPLRSFVVTAGRKP